MSKTTTYTKFMSIFNTGEIVDSHKSCVPCSPKMEKKIRAIFRECENYKKSKTVFGWKKVATTENYELEVNFVERSMIAPTGTLRLEWIEFSNNPDSEYTVEQLKEELKKFDWYYEMSDDHRYWKAGVSHQSEIIPMLNQLRGLPFETKKEIYESVHCEENFKYWVKASFFSENEISQL